MVDKLAEKLEALQIAFDEKNFPKSMTENDKIDRVTEDITDLRETLKLAKKELKSQFLEVEKAIARVETGTEGRVTAYKWIQIN